ncbi:Uncharacterised protein [uncultured archaeon]|nr:Uncharacterised protein [uncultured archaeon]
MENWHIKIDHGEALDSKKQLLSSELNLLHLLRHMKNYSILRKKETAINNKIKLNISSLRQKLTLLKSTLPKGAAPKIESRIKKVEVKLKTEEKNDFQNELDEIKAKLAKLG